MTSYRSARHVLFATPLGAMGINIFLPAMPLMQAHFHTSAYAAQLSLSLYVLTYGLFTLIAGILSEQFGRRPIYLYGLLLFVLSTWLIPFSPNISTLLILRLLQGVGAGVSAALSRCVIVDTLDEKSRHIYMVYLIAVWGLTLLLAPMIGGILTHLFGWAASFYFLGAYVLLVWLSFFWLPETLPKKQKISLKAVWQINFQYLTSLPFIAYLMCYGLSYGLMTSENVVLPFLLQKSLSLSIAAFSHVILLSALCWFIGSFVSRFLLSYWQPNQIMRITVWLCFISAFICVAGDFFEPVLTKSSIWIAGNSVWMLLLGGIMFAMAASGSSNYFKEYAGMTVAFSATIAPLIAAGISALVALISFKTFLPLSVVFLLIGVTLLLFVRWIPKSTPAVNVN